MPTSRASSRSESTEWTRIARTNRWITTSIGAHGDLVFAGAYAERSFALRVSYSMHGDITGFHGRHFLDTWAAANAGRWLPASLMVLAKPDGSWEEYNPKIPPQVAALLRRRPRYR